MSIHHFTVTQEFLVQFIDLYNCAKQSGSFAGTYVITLCTLQYHHPSNTWSNDIQILALQTTLHPAVTLVCLLLHRDLFYFLTVGLDLHDPDIFMSLPAWYTMNF